MFPLFFPEPFYDLYYVTAPFCFFAIALKTERSAPSSLYCTIINVLLSRRVGIVKAEAAVLHDILNIWSFKGIMYNFLFFHIFKCEFGVFFFLKVILRWKIWIGRPNRICNIKCKYYYNIYTNLDEQWNLFKIIVRFGILHLSENGQNVNNFSILTNQGKVGCFRNSLP